MRVTFWKKRKWIQINTFLYKRVVNLLKIPEIKINPRCCSDIFGQLYKTEDKIPLKIIHTFSYTNTRSLIFSDHNLLNSFKI